MFRVYLGNIPADVLLEEVWINGQRLLTSGGPERGYSIGPVVHLNGSRAYELQLPFENAVVHRMVRAQGLCVLWLDCFHGANFTRICCYITSKCSLRDLHPEWVSNSGNKSKAGLTGLSLGLAWTIWPDEGSLS